MNVLSALPRPDDNPWVIVGKNSGAHLTDLQKPWRRGPRVAKLKPLARNSYQCFLSAVRLREGLSFCVERWPFIVEQAQWHTAPRSITSGDAAFPNFQLANISSNVAFRGSARMQAKWRARVKET